MPAGTYKWSIEAKIAYYTDFAGPDDCWAWGGARNKGGHARLRVGRTHRYVMRILKKTPPQLWALHHCDNGWCVNPKHGYNGTPKQNTADKFNRGRDNTSRGESSGTNKLTTADILAIRQDKRNRRTIAKEYGVSLRTIFRVLSKESWSHI